tara:strand:+ start:641 stop:1204 length:564 start_codon:yes stop_codon:yes gene_type:complete
MKLLIIDNYDSFTFNLQHICEPHVKFLDVIRNDEINIKHVKKYDKIIISPGPGLPNDAGHCLELIQRYYNSIPILGICLGAQALGIAFGGELFNLNLVMHGKKSSIKILDKYAIIYRGISDRILVGRYHSWGIDISSNKNLIASAVDELNTVMSFTHKKHPITGIQYHPESILTENGPSIVLNWLRS